ncbi:uncharacterized protein J8A68_001404 [[Candida] subhashii]|uniref:BTB domain-containing protein n=1 Tax=[Candida] subhashii TaxID=561895 RepID=A0A8J5R3X5_9ASCO|nr:uncharacterized protein J8A68_001404 [[Candida] subhashii]KAG7665095.1 hypothetical protein J8A68_001404 [[Candida] subhashii]
MEFTTTNQNPPSLHINSLTGSIPAFNVKSTIVPCKGTPYVFLYGGFDDSDALDSNVYLLNVETMKWEIDDKCSGLYREGHSAIYIGNGNILVFGGLPFEDEIPSDDELGIERNLRGNATTATGRPTSITASTSQNFRRDNLMMIYNVFDRKWIGPPDFALENAPTPRSRHACCLSQDGSKLYISGGMMKSKPLDDLYCYDLASGVWTGPVQFVSRFDHTMMIYNDRIFLFGGIDKDMNHVKSVIYYSFKTKTIGEISIFPRLDYIDLRNQEDELGGGSLDISDRDRIYINSGINPALCLMVCLPTWNSTSSGVDISYLNLDDFDSQTLFNPHNLREYFKRSHQQDIGVLTWRCACVNQEGKLYLFGKQERPVTQGSEFSTTELDSFQNTSRIDDDEIIANKLEYLLEIDLSDFGIPSYEQVLARKLALGNGGLANDFRRMLLQHEYTDFEIIALSNEDDRHKYQYTGNEISKGTNFKSIPVHKMILLARWPHFQRVISVGMNETIENKMFIPEPVHWIKGLIYYFYVGSVEFDIEFIEKEFTIVDYSGLLTLANLYELSELKVITLNKLFKMFDNFKESFLVDQKSDANVSMLLKIWRDLSYSNETVFLIKIIDLIKLHWNLITRSSAFSSMSKQEIVKLCQDSSDVPIQDRSPVGSVSIPSPSTRNSIEIEQQVSVPATPTRNAHSPFVISPIPQPNFGGLSD